MPTWIALTSLALVVLGFLLVVFGWRGRRINSHPVCRQCRFDLDGISELVTCPECGAGLKRPGSTRRGVRKRVWSAVTVGTLMVLLPGSAIAVVLFAALTGVDSAAYKPVWLLTFEARHGAAAQVEAAGAELLARDKQGKLSESERGRAIETGLRIQADLSRPWDPASWGDFIDRALANGDLTDEQKAQFLANSFTLTFKPRKIVTADGVLPVVVEVGQSRAGTGTQFIAMIRGFEADAGGTPVEPLTHAKWLSRHAGQNQSIQSTQFGFGFDGQYGYIYSYGAAFPGATGPIGGGVLRLDIPSDFPTGRSTIDLMVFGMIEADMQTGYQFMTDENSRRDFESSTSFEIEVRPKGDELVGLIEPTDEMRKAARDVLSRTSIMSYAFNDSDSMLQMQTPVDDLDFGIAFHVTATWGDERVHLGIVTNGKNEPDMGQFGGARFYGGQMTSDDLPESVTLTFEPDVWVARGTVDLTSIYGEKVIIEDVRVEDQAAFMRNALSNATESEEDESDDP